MRALLRATLGMLLLASTALAFTVDLAWDAPDSGDPLQGYTMYRQRPGMQVFELIASIPVGTLTWSDTDVGRGNTCWYVTAYNQWGGEWS